MVRATPPEADDDDHRDDRFFHVVYEDNDKEDLTLAELLPLILPRGANLTTDLSTRPRWALFKKIYAAIADTQRASEGPTWRCSGRCSACRGLT